MYSPLRRGGISGTNEMAFHTPINFSKELKQVLFERNMLTAQTKKKLCSMLDSSGSQLGTPNTEMDKRRNFRLQAIEEIVSSEKSYLKHLETLMQFFVIPLKTRSIIDDVSHTTLFGQIEMIYNLNEELLRELEFNLNNVAQAFLKMAPFLKLYSVYAFDYKKSLLTVQQLTSSNAAFRRFLEQTESRPEVQRKLNSLMIVPIQRVPRYKLLLEQVLLYTSPADADFKLLKESVKQIESTVSHINSCIEDQEVTQLLINLQNSLLNHTPSIVKPSRKVIKEGVLHKVARDGNQIKRYCVLMSDIFMYCKILKERTPNTIVENSLECCCIFPLKKCKVYELFPGNFKLTCQTDGIIFCTSEVQLGRTWVAFIRDAIDMHIQCRKTLRKESSKRKPIRKNEVKNFELDYVLSPKRKCDYDTIFRNKNRSSDSEDEGKDSNVSSLCFSRPQSGPTSPYMPSAPVVNVPLKRRKRPAPPPPFKPSKTLPTMSSSKPNSAKSSDSSTKRISSRLYKFIASDKMCSPGILKSTNAEQNNSSNADHDPTYGFASRYSDSKSYFRTQNVDTIPTTVTREDFFAESSGNANFRDILFPLRSSGGSNKSGSQTACWAVPSVPISDPSKENITLQASLQRKRVKFSDGMDTFNPTLVQDNGGKADNMSKVLKEPQMQKSFVFPCNAILNTTTTKATLRDKIYEFFANLF